MNPTLIADNQCVNFGCNKKSNKNNFYCQECGDRREIERWLLQKEKQERRRRYTQKYFPKIAGDFSGVSWGDIQAENSTETKKHIDGFRAAGAKLSGAYIFWGAHGAGKTYLAMLILKTFFLAGKLRLDSAVTYPQFYMRAHAVRHHAFNTTNGVSPLQKHMLTAPVLVVDEIGKDCLAGDYFTNFMFDVVDERASLRASSLLTIFISNSCPKTLPTTHRYLASDRLVLFAPVPFTGKSKRKTPMPLWQRHITEA